MFRGLWLYFLKNRTMIFGGALLFYLAFYDEKKSNTPNPFLGLFPSDFMSLIHKYDLPDLMVWIIM